MTNFEKIKNFDIDEMKQIIMCPMEFDETFIKSTRSCSETNCINCCRRYLEAEAKEKNYDIKK